MHRFFLPPGECGGPTLVLTGGEARHAREVLRLQPGDEAVVLDGAGKQYFCQVREVDRRQVALHVDRTQETPKPKSRLTLLQAIPKGKIIESIIQKATELGVARVVPLLTERVATRLDGESAGAKAEKWRQVAVEASKQCGQTWLPEVMEPTDLETWLARGQKSELALVGSLQGDGKHPRVYFEEFARSQGGAPTSVEAWIGPEGDFTGEELDLIRGSGARPVDLGPLVLRSETAAIYTVSIIRYELGFNTGERL